MTHGRFPLGPPALAAVLSLAACTSTPESPPPLATLDAEAAEDDDLVARIAEQMAFGERLDGPSLMNRLEHLIPAWQADHRRLEDGPTADVVTQLVVTHFDTVVEALHTGPWERRLVAAWALGFARVPENDRGVRSRHDDAVAALASALDDASDEELRNILLAFWMLGDPDTPRDVLQDLVLQHHDGEVRANAALALGAVLTEKTAGSAVDTVLLALADDEPRVRIHAAGIARRFPRRPWTAAMIQRLEVEEMPLVRARLATALGVAGARQATRALVELLGSSFAVETAEARRALTAIHGRDLGPTPADWAPVLE